MGVRYLPPLRAVRYETAGDYEVPSHLVGVRNGKSPSAISVRYELPATMEYGVGVRNRKSPSAISVHNVNVCD